MTDAAGSETGRRRPNIVFITTDQQRFDSLGCNGGAIARTPTVDALAASGVRYERAHTQNVLCMPSRATMLTGQHPWMHGLWTNGVCLPRDAPSVATLLRDAGYATALVGKIHFETIAPHYGEYLRARGEEPLVEIVVETRDGRDMVWMLPNANLTAPPFGFDRLEMSNHAVSGHHALWLQEQLGWDGAADIAEESAHAFMGMVDDRVASDTGAPGALYSAIPPEYHSSRWVVDRTLAWIDSVAGSGAGDRPFFCWLSFDDPHHPFNPPAGYGRRHDWHDLPLPAARGATRAEVEADLAAKPWQYGAYWRGEFVEHEGTHDSRPLRDLTDDQLRELTALTAGMVELIDDSLARLVAGLRTRGIDGDTHVVFTTDHGELLGDHGLLLKGPFHLDGLMHVPLVWHAPGRAPAVVTDPVGLVDLAPTFCAIAGVTPPDWMEGDVLPVADGARERVVTVFDSHYRADLALRTMYRDGTVVTAYPVLGDAVGELYDLQDDPQQMVNRWDDPAWAARRADLLAELAEHLGPDGLAGPPPAARLPWWAHG